eukprot:EG_transcript_14439
MCLAAQLVVWKHRTPGGGPWEPYVTHLPSTSPSFLGHAWDEVKALHYAPLQADLSWLAWLLTDAQQLMTEAGRLCSDEERATFEWGLGMAHSRTFASAAWVADGGERLLVPLMDLINHGGEVEEGLPPAPTVRHTANVQWDAHPGPTGGRATQGYIAIRTLRAIEAGEELLWSYGERNNDHFLLHYGFVPPRNPHDDYVLFADWAEASDWLQRCGGLEEEAVALGGHALQVANLAPSQMNHCTSNTERARLRMYRGARPDPRLRSAIRAAYGDDAAAADYLLRQRCRELLAEAPTSLVDDLRLLARFSGLDPHGFPQLLAHYEASPEPVLAGSEEDNSPLPAAPPLVLMYRAYKKMVLADYLMAHGSVAAEPSG